VDANPARTAPRLVTTTDWWKLAAIAVMLVDHVGLYVFPDDAWWRVIGRATAPIFFFLVGYAQSRGVPWTWLAFGALLTAIDVYDAEAIWDAKVNILINFALIRWAMPWLEAFVTAGRARLLLALAVLTALVPVIGDRIEYGTEGWLWALFGLHQRLANERGTPGAASTRNLVAALAAIVYIVTEHFDFSFGLAEAFALALIVGVETVLLGGFSRAVSRAQPPAALVPAIGFLGRRTLEIYALHLLAFEAVDHATD
jgi:hypothetical protein